MMRTLMKTALAASLTLIVTPSDLLAGRGGGGRGGGGGMARGGMGGGMPGGGMGGMQRGGMGGMQGGMGGMQRGGMGGMQGGGMGGMERGGGGMNHSPSFSQPRVPSGGGRAPGNAEAGRRPQTGQPELGTRPQTGNRAYPGAASGAGVANRNQVGTRPNAGAAAAGAGVADRRQDGLPNNGAGVAGAGLANRNQNGLPNNGAGLAGAGLANRNQNPISNAGAAAIGAGYANRNRYDRYHPGMTNGYWNGNHAAWGLGAATYAGIAAWGVGSSMYGYGYSGYSNPYAGALGASGVGQPVDAGQPAAAPAYDYSQPISTTAAEPAPTATDGATAAFDQARDAFKANDYATALQGDQQALGLMPNDATLHEFLGLVYFAQGKYDAAAGPLYAVLSVGPGWDWTTLIGNYADANLYTEQLRALEAYVKANPSSAGARFVLAYHYITQGHGEAAVKPLKEVVALQPSDTLSAQLLAKLDPAAAGDQPAPAAPRATPFDAGKLTGNWVAQATPDSKINLSIKDDGTFTWSAAIPGKAPMSISGEATVADGVLTFNDKDSQAGALSGQVAWQDDAHFTFKAVGAPPTDPGLKFSR